MSGDNPPHHGRSPSAGAQGPRHDGPTDSPRGHAVIDPIVEHVLRGLPYCRDLDAPALLWLARRAQVRNAFRHQHILTEGGDSGALHVVLAGKVRVFKRSADGREHVLRTVTAGDSFNEVPIFDRGPDPANAEALEDTTMLVLGGHDVRQLAAESPTFAAAVLHTFAARLRHMTGLVQAIAFTPVTARVSALIYRLAVADGVAGPDGVTIPRSLTITDMAMMVGSVREVVSRILTRMQRDGLLALTREAIIVKDMERLKAAE